MNIQELYNSQLRKEYEERKTRIRSGKYNPSSFGRCFRNQYWNKLNEPKSNEPDDRGLRRMDLGLAQEKRICDKIILQAPHLRFQVRCETDTCLGFADIVDDQLSEVSDIKTASSRSFHYDEKELNSGKTPAEVYFNNFLQVMWYTQFLNKKYGRIVKVSKDDSVMAEPREELNDFWKDKLEMELTTLNYYKDFKTLPPAEPRTSWDCKFCDWETKCKEMNKKGKEKNANT